MAIQQLCHESAFTICLGSWHPLTWMRKADAQYIEEMFCYFKSYLQFALLKNLDIIG